MRWHRLDFATMASVAQQVDEVLTQRVQYTTLKQMTLLVVLHVILLVNSCESYGAHCPNTTLFSPHFICEGTLFTRGFLYFK